MELIRAGLGRPGVSRAVPVAEIVVAEGKGGTHKFASRRLDNHRTHQPAWRPLDLAVSSTRRTPARPRGRPFPRRCVR